MKTIKNRQPKIVVIGGGTGLPVILNALKEKDAEITAIVTVADDGGSSGTIRDYVNVVPPGDIRNVLVSLSELPQVYQDIFQYRFDSDDRFFAGHAIGNLIIAALAEMQGNMYEAIQQLAKMMHVNGHVYPAAQEALVLHAIFDDQTEVAGESKIALDRKNISSVYVTTEKNKPAHEASPKVVEAIMAADMVVLGPGSLFTSILPNLMITEIGAAVCRTDAQVVYICNIMTQLGETENFTDADHVKVLNQHLHENFIDTVLVNTEKVPENYMDTEKYDEYLVQVKHDFKGLRDAGCRVISTDFLKLKDKGVFHDGEKVVKELLDIVLQPSQE